MSEYTEAEHTVALTDTKYWIENPPASPEERYCYGRFHWRLKDYNEACRWFCLALEAGIQKAWFDIGTGLLHDLFDLETQDFPYPFPSDANICFQKAWDYYASLENPDCEGLYRKAFMLRYGYGTEADPKAARILFRQAVEIHPELTPASFRISCEYTIQGADPSASPEICKLPAGDALMELALYETDPSEKRRLLKKSYDFHCEEALFLDYRLFGSDFSSYSYPDEIRQLYSFRIGQYGRVCEVHPAEKVYRRMAQMYEQGFPGDDPARNQDFARKAKKYYDLMKSKEKIR